MASDILHIKDAYYFEVPKFLWHPHYKSLDDVPLFLRELHQERFNDYKTEHDRDHALEAFEHGMAGKVLIPQPFAELKSLHTARSGFAISKFMILELLVAVFMVLLFRWVAKRIVIKDASRGRLINLFEAVLNYIRVEIVQKNIHHGAKRFTPMLWTLFFFVLFLDLLGLVPFMGTATASFSCTLALAAAVLVTTAAAGFMEFGPKWVWTGFVPKLDMPAWLFPLKLLISVLMFAIEWLGMFIKHAVLAIRLLANMAAGHLVLLGILGLILSAARNPEGSFGLAAFFGIFGATALSVLELGVAFLQAYVFTLLSALFIGSAVHEH